MLILSKLVGVKRGLSPHCDWSACLHQHFFCTCIFNPTRPFFNSSGRGLRGSCLALSHGHLHHFLHQICLAPWGTLPLHNDIPITTSQKLQPTLLIVTSRTLGPLALSVRVSHFLGRRLLPIDLLEPVQMALQTSCTRGIHELVGHTKTLKHFRAGFVHIRFWCLGTGTH